MTLELSWMATAHSYVGLRELVNGALNPVVRGFFAFTGYPKLLVTKKTPWCGAYVSACLERAGIRSKRTARAASYATWGVPCSNRIGSVVVLGKASPDAGGSGHVGFRAGPNLPDGTFLLLSGNSANQCRVHPYRVELIVAERWPVEA
jgi:uncharacterized protein (TIGR02594 family)